MKSSDVISVAKLCKSFSFPIKDPKNGFLKNLLHPDKKTVRAVKDVSFSIKKGERVAFIGPNGAGKSTTIKMLTGILFPSSGKIRVLGIDPIKDRKKLAYRIGTVFGQRSQLIPNLPLTDSLEFFGVMYDMSNSDIKMRIDELVGLFEMEDFKNQPVRKLSLGQRMRAEIAASLMHRPEIIFLDEPTIGLDVVAKKALRDLLKKVNREENTTIFLTSHDVGDIESLCERTIIINHGEVVRDLPTIELAKSFVKTKKIDIVVDGDSENYPELTDGLEYIEKTKEKITVEVDLEKTSVKSAIRNLLDLFDVDDINVYDTDLESIIRNVYEDRSTRD